MSNQKRRIFTPEFKAAAVEMTTRANRSVTRVARELGIGKGLLHEWINQARGEAPSEDTLARGGGTETEHAEVIRLRREVTTLRMERDFLKKVTAFFAKESR